MTLVIGHRGAAGLMPENTLAAFQKAIELKTDAVELDVQLSRDGELVIHHNYWLNPDITRTSDGSWLKERVFIKDVSLSELKTYDVGRLRSRSIYSLRYPDQQAIDGERIPTLQEVISLFKQSSRKKKPQLWVEIKTSPLPSDHSSSPQAVGDALFSLLKKEKITKQVKILSFDWRSLYHAQQIAPDIPTFYLTRIGGIRNIQPGQPGPNPYTAPIEVDDFEGSIPLAIKAGGGSAWAPHHREVSIKQVKEAHRLGLQVYVWSPDGAGRMRRLIEKGVDGIITNHPEVLQKVCTHS